MWFKAMAWQGTLPEKVSEPIFDFIQGGKIDPIGVRFFFDSGQAYYLNESSSNFVVELCLNKGC